MAGDRIIREAFSNEFGEFSMPELPRKRLLLRVSLAAEGQQIDLALNRFQDSSVRKATKTYGYSSGCTNNPPNQDTARHLSVEDFAVR